MAEALVFTYGAPNPVEGFHLTALPLPVCGPGQVVVRFLAAPVNPLDMAVIHGKYPVKPQSTITGKDDHALAIPGSDGVARVIRIGSGVSNFAVDETVILRSHCRGTWRTHAVFEESDLLRIPDGIDFRVASILRMGVAPAYFLLRDYHALEPGDWIIQNAAMGTISHFVTQLASFYGVRVISIIRDRSTGAELERTKRSLCSHGASLVLTEDELRTTTALTGKRIVLALDAISDDALSRDMAACLVPGATLVTTGFLAARHRPEVNLRQTLWQRNVTLKAFRLSDCLGRRALAQQTGMFEWFATLLARGSLKTPVLNYVHWKQGEQGLEQRLKGAIKTQESGAIGVRKTVLVFGQ